MDWTGGTRRRYAGKGKGNPIVQKQKAHFARARAAIGHQIIPDTAAPTSFKRPPDSQSRVTSRGRRASLASHEQRSHHDTDRTARRTQRLRHAAHSREQPKAAITEEEAALIANRERLLARNDWLGLAATRPVRLRYPSDGERQRIGKRRKIDKPRVCTDLVAELHTIAHPAESRRVPFELMMSGAIGNDDIQIRVGTDAFLSQTQPSRRSHNSPNTSIRPISTDLGPISEESMLLKADSDGFEAQEGICDSRFEGLEVVEQRLREHSRETFTAQYDEFMWPDAHRQDGWAARSDYSPMYDYEQSHYSSGSTNNDRNLEGQYSHKMPIYVEDHRAKIVQDRAGCNSMYKHASDVYIDQHTPPRLKQVNEAPTIQERTCSEREDSPENQALVEERTMMISSEAGRDEAESSMYPAISAAAPHSRHTVPRGLHWPELRQDAEIPPLDSLDEENDERAWKSFMQIKQELSSRISVAALRSSSQHLTTESTTSAWPINTIAEGEAELEEDMLDNHQHLDDLALEVRSHGHQHMNDTQVTIASILISSPSPSRHQNLQTVLQAPAAEVPNEDDGQDELWRQFVVGSQSSQSPSSQGRGRKLPLKSSDELLPVQHPPVGSAVDQLRSDRMTTGGSNYAAAATDTQADASSQSQINTSLVGHATTINPESDDLEEPESTLRNERKTTIVIHANAANASANARPKQYHHQSKRRTKYAPVPRVLTKENLVALRRKSGNAKK